MTRHTFDTVNGKENDRLTVTNPAAVAERSGVTFERRTDEHDDAEHCETDAAGRASVGTHRPVRFDLLFRPERDTDSGDSITNSFAEAFDTFWVDYILKSVGDFFRISVFYEYFCGLLTGLTTNKVAGCFPFLASDFLASGPSEELAESLSNLLSLDGIPNFSIFNHPIEIDGIEYSFSSSL